MAADEFLIYNHACMVMMPEKIEKYNTENYIFE